VFQLKSRLKQAAFYCLSGTNVSIGYFWIERNPVVIRAMAQEGAAGIATAVAESVQYQGRKASRQGSEQRRQDILDAAMRIVVRDGVRAVRHRAVATEAGVPLSATTYYFKDIDDLLTDTFAQYVERSAAYMAKLWVNNEGLLARNDRQRRRQPASRARNWRTTLRG
jgi:AcrR family transcriptional regulator